MDERDQTPAAHAGPPQGGQADERVLTIDDLVICDDEPKDSIFVEKQQCLLAESLYASWRGPGKGRTFRALSNVGLFPELKQTTLIPDVMLAVDVPVGRDLSRKENNSYFVWVMGKPPDVVIEIVSHRPGDEDGYKMTRYAQIGVPYYVIFDPEDRLGGGVLRSFERQDGGVYRPLPAHWFPAVNLGVKLWEGYYARYRAQWLRWCDARGRLLRTGPELADAARPGADTFKRQADAARRQAEEDLERCKRLEAQLRALGIEPVP
jgi:Uma2 family endonuclease